MLCTAPARRRRRAQRLPRHAPAAAGCTAPPPPGTLPPTCTQHSAAQHFPGSSPPWPPAKPSASHQTAATAACRWPGAPAQQDGGNSAHSTGRLHNVKLGRPGCAARTSLLGRCYQDPLPAQPLRSCAARRGAWIAWEARGAGAPGPAARRGGAGSARRACCANSPPAGAPSSPPAPPCAAPQCEGGAREGGKV